MQCCARKRFNSRDAGNKYGAGYGLSNTCEPSLCAIILLAEILGCAMGTVNVRRLDDEVVGRLKRRAAENNRSLESEARHILEKAVEDGMVIQTRVFRDLARTLRERTAGMPQTPSYALIREDRDGGHESA